MATEEDMAIYLGIVILCGVESAYFLFFWLFSVCLLEFQGVID